MLKLTNDKKKWVVKNLIKGVSVKTISDLLVNNGMSEEAANSAISELNEETFIEAAKEFREKELGLLNRNLNNANWLLNVYDKLSRESISKRKIKRIEVPSWQHFLNNYLSKNEPVIMKSAMVDWPIYHMWTPEYFNKKFGDKTVEVQLGRENDINFERNNKLYKKKLLFKDFIQMVTETESSNDFYMTANNLSENNSALSELIKEAYDCKIGDDYLISPDSGSIWFGPKGTVTPLHFDMINNFFCQIYGKKRIRLIPSWNLPWVYNDYHVFSEVDLLNIDYTKHPLFKNVDIYDVTIEAGEILFIPIGWWHHLIALETSISITKKNLNVKYGNYYSKGFIR